MQPIVTLKAQAVLCCFVTETIRVPAPVYEKVTQQAEQKDVSRGAVVTEWMEKAEKYAKMEDKRY